ncbi:MAG: 4-hydroxyphenylacetate 3-hydroxylase [Gammaproteobacteria bacterium]|nr:4-hydroxyphenylacetate 3-hydroxylase [Gammaproteobacteria bacterium]
MGLMTAAHYRASLDDGRVIHWGGEKIAKPSTHPRFRVPLEVAARDYAYDDPTLRDLLVYETEENQLANRIFQVPRTPEELSLRLALGKHMSIVGGVTGVYMALLQIREKVAAVNPLYGENIERVYRNARQHDLRAAEVITDAKGDRSKKAHEQLDPDLYLRIVERRPEGIVVRGAKLHITGAALVHELVVMPTKAMRAEEADYAVAFCIPVNTPGVRIINRSFAPADLNEFDYPASAHHSIPEGFVVFDDVLVPWDRVLLAGEYQLAGAFAAALGLWERTLGLVLAEREAEIMVGLADLVTEQQGKERDPHVQDALAELMCYAETIRMGLDHAVRHYESTASGMLHPNTLSINVTKYYYASHFHQMVGKLHDVAGGLTITLPEEADLRDPESGPYLRKYLAAKPGTDIEQRMRVYTLIRDLTADAYGGWNLVTALQAGGGLKAQRIMMARTYDMPRARRSALAAAGALKDH